MATAQGGNSTTSLDNIPNCKDFKIGLVVSEWNKAITQKLFQGAFEKLILCGISKDNIVRWDVPGSFELIYGCKKMQKAYDMLDAIIAIGNVIQGQTKHFDYICQGITQGLVSLNLQSDIPIIYCVLTDNHLYQSIDRSGGRYGNKGAEAAIAAIKMSKLRKDANF